MICFDMLLKPNYIKVKLKLGFVREAELRQKNYGYKQASSQTAKLIDLNEIHQKT